MAKMKINPPVGEGKIFEEGKLQGYKVEANDVVSAFIGTVNYLNTRLSSILGTLQKIV